MAVFRVERNKGYTVMSNHHLRNKELSLKSKGLLSQMLSLPEDWDYTLAGLAQINKESIDAIRTAVWELERLGYIKRHQGRDEKGKMTAIEYIIYETPKNKEEQPMLENPTTVEPTLENPILENPTSDNPTSENPMEINKDILNTDLKNKDKQTTYSIPFLSLSSRFGERKRKDVSTQSVVEMYKELIKENIEYDILCQDSNIEKDRLDEIVDIMIETVCTSRKTIRIAGDDFPAELVKGKFMKINSSHIQFVFDSMRDNTSKIRNIKQYIKAVLFNAPSTMGNYYTALVAHDMASGKF